ncbi:ATP-grasp domain-containing protein [Trueperella pecoris]|uniref:D-alanine--D-alanine ligase n=1 Tax=Trueperella pecoris TaxID=2733571 RepID=A0A7M1R0S3_9ACTO|nr:ATP-grasp domain-containing protein [Trueperella pecoris]QOR47733.1 ATP-grasp domain-containing protein [Trueperella pecoris]
MRPLTVAVLAGGLTHECEVSLHSGRRVAESLRNSGIQVKVLDVDAQLLQRLDAIEPDVVWPLVHGSIGEDGSLQDLLVLAGYPFVGSEAFACRLASDKSVAASVLARAGLRVPDSLALPQTLFREVGVGNILNLVEARFSFPLVVKPTQAGSSMGLSIVEDRATLPGAMVDCFAYGDVALIQQYVSGREFGVAVADLGEGPKALPAVEVRASGPYDYDARYNPGRVEYLISDGPDATVRSVMDMAEDVHRALGLRHYSRTDIMVDDAGVPWFLDVNVAPGMSETSIFPQAAAALARQQERSVDDVYLDILTTAAHSADAVTE